MATVATIATRTLGIGPNSVQTVSPIASGLSQMALILNQVGWPLAGDLAFTYVLDWSPDGGATWVPIVQGDIIDVAAGGAHGFPAGQFRIGGTIGGVGNANRLVRFSWNGAKAVQVNGTIDAS